MSYSQYFFSEQGLNKSCCVLKSELMDLYLEIARVVVAEDPRARQISKARWAEARKIMEDIHYFLHTYPQYFNTSTQLGCFVQYLNEETAMKDRAIELKREVKCKYPSDRIRKVRELNELIKQRAMIPYLLQVINQGTGYYEYIYQ